MADHRLLGEDLLIALAASCWLILCDNTSLWWQHQSGTAGQWVSDSILVSQWSAADPETFLCLKGDLTFLRARDQSLWDSKDGGARNMDSWECSHNISPKVITPWRSTVGEKCLPRDEAHQVWDLSCCPGERWWWLGLYSFTGLLCERRNMVERCHH